MTGAAASPVAPIPLRHRLRAGTRLRHEALHRHPLLSRLTPPCLSRGEYEAILAAFLATHAAAEARRAALGLYPELSLAPASAALAADLGTGAATMGLPLFDWVDGAEQALGMLYVLHGARFGAGVIARGLRAERPGFPSRYFGGEGQPPVWPALLAALGRMPPREATSAALLHAANATFVRVGDALDAAQTARRPGPLPRRTRRLDAAQGAPGGNAGETGVIS